MAIDPVARRLTRAESEVTIAVRERDRAVLERNEAYQALFDVLVILRYDVEGDTKPTALLKELGHRGFIDKVKYDVMTYRLDPEVPG